MSKLKQFVRQNLNDFNSIYYWCIITHLWALIVNTTAMHMSNLLSMCPVRCPEIKITCNIYCIFVTAGWLSWCRLRSFLWVFRNRPHAFPFCLLHAFMSVKHLFSARMCTPVIYHQCHEVWQRREHVLILPHIYFYLLIAYQHAGDEVIWRWTDQEMEEGTNKENAKRGQKRPVL